MISRSIIFAAALALAGPAMAQTDEDRATVSDLLHDLAQMMTDKDLVGLYDSEPPALREYSADFWGVSQERQREAMRRLMANPDEVGATENPAFSLDAAEWGVSPAGRDYAVIPFSFVARAPNFVTLRHIHVLALTEDDQWYLLRVSGRLDMEFVVEAYPDLAGLDIPEQVLEPAP
ncbi:MAG: hypothetical protein Q4G25_10765 [Paracoccus sp. (in: a-proteobacteria)]|nr:hypothetical protein [Paracoccus sp. (in: a-proteobacteria)]